MRVLAFDASTTTIGIAVIDYDDSTMNLVHCSYYKPNKKLDLFERLAAVREMVCAKIAEYKPDDVVIEDIILFMKGHSTAKTVTSLAVLNRTVGLAVYNAIGRSPALLNVTRIRHAAKLSKELPPKEDVPNLVEHHLKLDFPWMHSKKGKVLTENYDVADAILCGCSFILLKRKGTLVLAKKKKKKVKK